METELCSQPGEANSPGNRTWFRRRWDAVWRFFSRLLKVDFIVVLLLLFSWFGLFMAGAWVSSKDYIHSVLFQEPLPWSLEKPNITVRLAWYTAVIHSVLFHKPLPWSLEKPNIPTCRLVWYAIVAFLSWGWTNLAMLSCSASTLGEMSRPWLQKGAEPADYRAGLARGFVIFLLALSGQLVMLGTLPSIPRERPLFTDDEFTQNIYLRLAGAVSLVSFFASLNPGWFFASFTEP